MTRGGCGSHTRTPAATLAKGQAMIETRPKPGHIDCWNFYDLEEQPEIDVTMPRTFLYLVLSPPTEA